jgi:hypothetical protein
MVFLDVLGVVGGFFVSGGSSGWGKGRVTGHGVGVVFNGKYKEAKK